MGCAKHQGVKWNWSCKLGSVILQIIDQGRGNEVTASRYIDQVLRLHCHLLHVIGTAVSSMTSSVLILYE